MFELIKVILFVAVFESIKCDWTLVPVDPTQYGSQYPACQTALQYPVNLNTSAAIYYQSLAPISFVNFDKPLYFNFTNNGYTIFAYQTRDLSVSPFIIGSDFGSDVYVFQQFHFHWAADVYSGSQHLINNKAYPLELHIVHQSYSGYIGVVAFLFELSNSDNPGLLDLIRIVGNDLGKNGSTIANLTLSNILPNIATANKDGYYRYLGSFSTPPCNDGVIWNVYKDRIPISGNQLLYFYKNSIKFNTRSVTNLSPRPLFVSVQNTQ